jgi:hypothetical protein
LDGGGWVFCSSTSDPYNECVTFDEEGRSLGARLYVLRNLGRPARPEELKYTYLTGKAIGLERGLELVEIVHKK